LFKTEGKCLGRTIEYVHRYKEHVLLRVDSDRIERLQ